MTLAKPAKPKISEAAFQRQVIQLAQMTGWRVAHFRPAQNARGDWRTPVAADGKGFPDLVLVRETVLFVELKVNGNKLAPDQVAWRDALQAAGANWHLWTDDDWPAIEQALKREPMKARDAAAQTRVDLFAAEQNLKFVDNDNLGLKSALEAAHIAMTDALVYHHHTLGGPIKAALNAAINDANAVLRSAEAEAIL